MLATHRFSQYLIKSVVKSLIKNMINKIRINRHLFLATLILLLAQFLIPQSALANTEVDYQTLDWDDLAPTFPELERARSGANLSAIELHVVYEKLWSTTNVVEELDGKNVRISGFIVPLEFGEEQIVTEFFLVPYHGACIHSPAPPPNQLIMVDYEEGMELESTATPYWVSGEMSLKVAGNELGTSGYGIEMHSFEIYTE